MNLVNPADVKTLYTAIADNVEKVIYGKREQIRMILVAMLCGGHVLLDDIPGTGKTSMARALSTSVGADCKRIQFTPDLLPSDITGISFFNQKESEFVFRPGPLFTNIVIADEINRTTPRTQSALLECMEERQTTVDGVTYRLPAPFLVLATQNPIESQGTFPLPEAQTDRFFMKLSMGYPDAANEKKILDDYILESPLATLGAVCSAQDILDAIRIVRSVTVSDPIKEYIVRIVTATRESDRVRLGVSPRGTLALMRAAQGFAATAGRDYVLPDDVKAVATAVLSHRIISRSQNTVRLTRTNETIIEYIIEHISAPI